MLRSSTTTILYYSLLYYSLVPINLLEHFTIIKPEDVRLTRKTATISDDKDVTSINCNIKPSCAGYFTLFAPRVGQCPPPY